MLRGKTLRRANVALVYVVAVSLIATAGPSLALPNLVTHTVLGVALVLATLGHLWLNRDQVISWPTSPRLRRPQTGLGWLLKGQDALREWLFGATLVSGVMLMVGGPGVDVHATVGFTLLGMAVVHAGLHRSWFAARFAKRRQQRP